VSSLPQRRASSSDGSAAIYVRVSSKEQVEGYSLDAQRRACREFCEARGYTIVSDYADEGVSAHTDNLPKRLAFSRMLADAQSGRFSVIVVHKMDRFARKLRVALECLEQLGRAHVGVVSVSKPNLDYSTPQGFLFLSMLGALAEWYSRNLATETKKGWAERKRRGLYAGRLPFGVVKGENGIPRPDTAVVEANKATTTNHTGLLLAFERAANGATDIEVAEVLNAGGYRPSAHARRARFTREAIRTILVNRFYVGELPMGKRGADGWLKGAHDPLVPVELFDAVQRQRTRRATNPNASKVNKNARVHALSGLVRCGECGESMHLEGAQRLSCWGRRRSQGCRAATVAARVIEEELGRFLRGIRLPDDTQVRILTAYREARPEVTERDRQRQSIEGQLRRLGDLFVMGDLSKSEYESRRAELRTALSRLEEPEAHGRPEMLDRLQRYVLNAGAAWDDADDAQRNRLVRALFESVLVRDRHLPAVQPRPEFQPYLALMKAEAPTPSDQGRRCHEKECGGGLEGIRTPGLGLDRAAC
jgi:site-specific DNA recombinase